MDISDVFLIMKLSNWCLMATYKHINIILGTVLCTLCHIFRLVKVLFVPRQLHVVCDVYGHDRHELGAHFCAQCGN
jgi:hypothetical protein